MPTALVSSAPHLAPATTWADDLKDWGPQPDPIAGTSHSSGRLLWKSADGAVEAGLWLCTPGIWRLSIPKEEVCHFIAGRARYREDGGAAEILAEPGTLVHFRPGWTGVCVVEETMRVIYMAAPYPGAQPGGAHVLRETSSVGELVDWGAVPTMIEGVSRTSGRLLYRREDRGAETGLWVCTPGTWSCHVTSDELCHFLDGRCTYTHESGEVIEIVPDTAAFFPKDWRGTCRIERTMRKIYMIR